MTNSGDEMINPEHAMFTSIARAYTLGVAIDWRLGGSYLDDGMRLLTVAFNTDHDHKCQTRGDAKK